MSHGCSPCRFRCSECHNLQEQGFGNGAFTDAQTILVAVGLEHMVLVLRRIIDMSVPNESSRVLKCRALDAFEDQIYRKASLDTEVKRKKNRMDDRHNERQNDRCASMMQA